MRKLTVENTNAVEHRLAGDTLVFECPDCEWGEIVVTELLEGPGSACPDCGARFELFAARVEEEPADDEASDEGESAGDRDATEGRLADRDDEASDDADGEASDDGSGEVDGPPGEGDEADESAGDSDEVDGPPGEGGSGAPDGR